MLNSHSRLVILPGRDGYLRARLRIRKERQVGVRKQQFSLWPLRSAPGSLGTYGFLTPPYGFPYGLELKNNPRLCTSLRVYASNTPQEAKGALTRWRIPFRLRLSTQSQSIRTKLC